MEGEQVRQLENKNREMEEHKGKQVRGLLIRNRKRDENQITRTVLEQEEEGGPIEARERLVEQELEEGKRIRGSR